MFLSPITCLSGLVPSLSVYRSSKSLAQTSCRQSAASAVWTVAPGFGTAANTGRRCLLTPHKQQQQRKQELLLHQTQFHVVVSPIRQDDCRLKTGLLLLFAAVSAAEIRFETADEVVQIKVPQRT